MVAEVIEQRGLSRNSSGAHTLAIQDKTNFPTTRGHNEFYCKAGVFRSSAAEV
jgi:hypothetical protein